MLPPDALALFAAVVCLGIFTQAATGFAAGLVIMPLMLWAGQGIPEAQAALLVSTIPQNTWGFFKFRETIAFKELALPASLRLLALPVGTATLFLINDFPEQMLRQFIGLVVVVCVVVLITFRPKPREHLHPAWMWLAFPLSGFFQGCSGTGGPMMVLWVQAHDWSTKRIRAFLFFMYLVTIIPSWALLYYWFGKRILPASVTAAAVIPLLLLSTTLGLRVGTWLGRDRLRRVTMGLLLVVGLVGVFSPMLATGETETDTEAIESERSVYVETTEDE